MLVGADDPAQGELPPDGADFTLFANYATTFEITAIDAAGALITEWSMQDLATRQVVFNQDGRVTSAAPVPGTPALLALGMAGAGLASRRRAD